MATVASSVSSNATQWSGQGHAHVAPSGEAIAFYYDGATWQYKTATMPSGSWSSASAVTGALNPGSLASCMDPATGDIHVVYKRTGGPLPTYRKFTKGGGGGWTMGSASNIATTGDYANDAAPPHICLDLSGRIWVQMSEWVGGYTRHIFYSSNGTSWTDFFSGGSINNGGNAAHIAPCYNGATQYILTIYQAGGEIRWRRVQTSGGSVGTITSEQVVNYGVHDDHTSHMAQLSDGRVMLLATPSFGNEYAPTAFIYNPATDTWGTGTTVGTNTTDRWPSLVNNPSTGTMYGAWSEGASNSYAICYKEFTPGTSTWGSKQTLQATGSDRIYGSLACDGTTLLDVLTNATSSIVESLTATVGTPPGPPTGGRYYVGGNPMAQRLHRGLRIA